MTTFTNEHMRELGALAIAARGARCALRDEIRAARTFRESSDTLAAILADRPTALDRVPVWTVLRWCRRMPAPTARRIMARAGIRDENRPVGQLTDRQITSLVEQLNQVGA